MLRVFNCGIGMARGGGRGGRRRGSPLLEAQGESVTRIGRIEAGDGEAADPHRPAARLAGMRRRVGVLISGRGSNMAALLDAARDPDYPAEIVAGGVQPPARARAWRWRREAGVEALPIDHRRFGSDRAAHEAAIDAALRRAGVEIVCLAGYMRLLTPFLVGAWTGRMLNIHPSLLPAFPGLHTHERALAAGREAARLHRAPGHQTSWTKARSWRRPPCRCCRTTTRTGWRRACWCRSM